MPMKRLTRGSIALVAVALMMAVSGLAAAAVGDDHETETEEGDTRLVVGFDEDNGLLVTGVSPTDHDNDCTVASEAEGDFGLEYAEPDDSGKVPTQDVTALTDGDGADVEFAATEEGGDAVAYPDLAEDDPCRLRAASVAGKNGQVNHGQVVSTFNKMIEGKKGCVMRLIAHTDLGKGDMQVKPSDLDPDAEPVVATAGQIAEFLSETTTCDKKNRDEDGLNPGQAKKAERAASGASPGKSGDAPGKNKGG
jgi:hypothetical protein